METTYKKEGNKLVKVDSVETEFSLEELLKRKSEVESLIVSVNESKNAEIASYQKNLADINATIAKAQELGVEPEPQPEPEPEPQPEI